MKKNSEHFGQDPLNVPAIRAELLALVGDAHPDLRWAALIDAAFDYPAAEESPYWARGINCYGSQAYEGLNKAAPMLVPVDPINDEAFLTRLLHHCHDRPMVSFLGSRIDLKKLCKTWQPLHWITAIDHQKMLLRLADTRVLAVLPQLLGEGQWAAFAAPVAEWSIVGRTGRLTPLSLPNPEVPRVSSIHFEHDQLASLLSSAEPDNILSLISNSMSEILPPDPQGSKCYAMVSESCELARMYNVINWSDIVSLSVAALLTDGRTNQDTCLSAYLARKQWPPGDLGASLVSENFL